MDLKVWAFRDYGLKPSNTLWNSFFHPSNFALVVFGSTKNKRQLLFAAYVRHTKCNNLSIIGLFLGSS